MRSARALGVLPFLLLACGSKAPLHQSSDGGGDVGHEVSAPRADAPVTPIDLVTRDAPADRTDADASADDGPRCCEPGPGPASCLDLGGAKNKFGCFVVCDFWCSTNWRLELDDRGCPAWRMDYRKPAPGESELCFPDADASTPDASETKADASGTS
jgi:predicted small lipoprotein YifL